MDLVLPLKKIFGLFAMAALAATGLTCCGGGGGGDDLSVRRFCFKKISIQAPGPVTDPNEGKNPDDPDYDPNLPWEGEGNAFSGHVTIKVLDMENELKARATASFGDNTTGSTYQGYFEVVGGTPEAPKVTFYLTGGAGADEAFQEWSANFIPDDLEEGDTVLGIPAPYVTFDNWIDNTGGTCTLEFNVGSIPVYVRNVSFSFEEA